jgi:hypothetical protein
MVAAASLEAPLTLPDGKHLLMYTVVAPGGRRLDGKAVDRQVQ